MSKYEKLIEDYPKLFEQTSWDRSKSCMYYGVECGEGWYAILDDLCKKLCKYPIQFAQVKEKFGALRVYHTTVGEVTDEEDEALDKLISDAESLSCETCESCGDPGIVRRGGWIVTCCEPCWEKRCQKQ